MVGLTGTPRTAAPTCTKQDGDEHLAMQRADDTLCWLQVSLDSGKHGDAAVQQLQHAIRLKGVAVWHLTWMTQICSRDQWRAGCHTLTAAA